MTYILFLLITSAQTGELIRYEVKGHFDTDEQCIQATMDMGPQTVRDGEARTYWCGHEKQVTVL